MLAAMVFLTLVTAPFEALYHTSPGRGRTEPMLEILIILPPWPCFCNCGTTAFTLKKILRTLTLNTRSNSSSVTLSVGLFRYVVPAARTQSVAISTQLLDLNHTIVDQYVNLAENFDGKFYNMAPMLLVRDIHGC
jgi:hypothetical protein